MHPLWLDYQRADPTRRRPGLALLGVGILAVLLTGVDYLAVAAERDDAQAQVDALRQTAASRPAPSSGAAAASATPPAGRSARRWDALFSALEAASNDDVTLLSLHPTDKEIQLTGEAKDFTASMDYLQRLQSQPVLANARVTQSETVAENPHHPLRFSLVADWRGAPP